MNDVHPVINVEKDRIVFEIILLAYCANNFDPCTYGSVQQAIDIHHNSNLQHFLLAKISSQTCWTP
jgi:hypothetical protein